MTLKHPLIARARRLMLKLGWGHPFFLMPAAEIRLRVTDKVSTAAVHPRGICYLNPEFCGTLTDDDLQGVLAHELMHLLLNHAGRAKGRDPQRWNFAADRAINHGLREAGIRLPDCALYPARGTEGQCAEQLYEIEPVNDNADAAKPTGGCGSDGSDGGLDGEGEVFPDDAAPDGPTLAEAARRWLEVAAASAAVSAGSPSGAALAGVLKPPAARVAWKTLLRQAVSRACAAHGADDVSWRKLNRRCHSTPFLIPGPVSLTVKLAVIIDTSGSVGDDALARAVAETISIARAYPHVGITLIAHDSRVTWEGVLRGDVKASDVTQALVGRGGTDFVPAYAALAKYGRHDALVHLTDGYPQGAWPKAPTRASIVGLLGTQRNRVTLPPGYRAIEITI